MVTCTGPIGLPSREFICAMTILNDEVFVVSKATYKVEVYTFDTSTLKRRINVGALTEPFDMASSVESNCIYISDKYNGGSVHRVKATGKVTTWRVDDMPDGLSMMLDGVGVLVTCRTVGELKEYSTVGEFVCKIRLQEDLLHPRHAAQVAHGLFAVCHGIRADSLRGVSIVDENGSVAMQYRLDIIDAVDPAMETTVIIRAAVRMVVDANRSIIVVDSGAGKILLFNDALTYTGELVVPFVFGRSWCPTRICLDASGCRFFVSYMVG